MFCILCGESGKAAPLDQVQANGLNCNNLDENSDDLFIHPCLCNFKSHRECLRAYVLSSRKAGCDRCKVLYAISPQKLDLSPRKYLKRFSIFFAEIIVMVMILSLFIFALERVIAKHNDGTINSQALFVMLVAFCIFLIISMLIGGLVWLRRRYFSPQTQDLKVYCKQTEIAFHVENSDTILKAFLEQELQKKNSEKLTHAQKMYDKFDLARFNNAMSLKNMEEQIYQKTFRKKSDGKALKDSLIVTEFSRKSVIKMGGEHISNAKDISDSQILRSLSKNSLSGFRGDQSECKEHEEEKNAANVELDLPVYQNTKADPSIVITLCPIQTILINLSTYLIGKEF